MKVEVKIKYRNAWLPKPPPQEWYIWCAKVGDYERTHRGAYSFEAMWECFEDFLVEVRQAAKKVRKQSRKS